MTTNKLMIGVGAIALAAAASLSPLVAQAEPAGDTDSSSASSDTASTTSDTGSDVGNAAGRKAAKTNRGGTPRATANTPPPSVVSGARTDTAPGAGALGSNPLIQNPLIWIGTPNPAPPTPVYTREFNALADLPDWTQAYSGWFSNLNFEACILGLSNTTVPSAGPYGTSTNSISTGGC